MKAPDAIEQVYTEVLEDFSKNRQSEMKQLISLLTRTTDPDDASPDKHMTPIENGDGYLNPFSIAKFGNFRRFSQEFPNYVSECLEFFISKATESKQITFDQGSMLVDKLVEWVGYMKPLMEKIMKSASDANIDFVKFCTNVRISNLFQRADVLFKDGSFDVDCVFGAIVAVELDIKVLERLIKSPVTNDLFGGEVVVNRKGIDHKIDTPSIADLL